MMDSSSRKGAFFAVSGAPQMQQIWPQVEQARALFDRLCRDGKLPDDRQLARSRDYRAFLALGLHIRAALPREMFRDVTVFLCDGHHDASATAAQHLSHLWAGLAEMPVAEPPARRLS